MAAIELDKLTWPEVRAQLEAGRDTVVMALGATEQHGRHMPLATDALLGDHFARLLADRLDAFLAPTLRIGCSAHHVGFAGTMSLSEETFHCVVADVVGSLAGGGFRRIVLIPTHGGNFAPLAAAAAKLGDGAGARVVALSDLGVLFQIARMAEREYGVPLREGGIHAGEWETSLLLAIHPELVRMDRAEAGFTGDLEEAMAGIFASGGVAALSENGTIGDPARATAEHGQRYWQAATQLVLDQIAASQASGGDGEGAGAPP
jgi:creatinine amidohydrolase/Fe(II)-dependent formamide hydrolase-like protein